MDAEYRLSQVSRRVSMMDFLLKVFVSFPLWTNDDPEDAREIIARLCDACDAVAISSEISEAKASHLKDAVVDTISLVETNLKMLIQERDLAEEVNPYYRACQLVFERADQRLDELEYRLMS